MIVPFCQSEKDGVLNLCSPEYSLASSLAACKYEILKEEKVFKTAT
jgi:hypothetical protein